MRLQKLGRPEVSRGAGRAEVRIQSLVGRVDAKGVQPHDDRGLGVALLDLRGSHDPGLLLEHEGRDGRALPFLDRLQARAGISQTGKQGSAAERRPASSALTAMGNRAIVSRACSVKPPPGPFLSDPWKKAGKVSHVHCGPLHVVQGLAGGAGAGVGGSGTGTGVAEEALRASKSLETNLFIWDVFWSFK